MTEGIEMVVGIILLILGLSALTYVWCNRNKENKNVVLPTLFFGGIMWTIVGLLGLFV